MKLAYEWLLLEIARVMDEHVWSGTVLVGWLGHFPSSGEFGSLLPLLASPSHYFYLLLAWRKVI